MKHELAVQQKMTERYLLNELDPDSRDEFEEHFFDCQECALDVRAGATFVDQGKIILAEKSELVATPVPAPVRPGWFGWLRPAFAVPVMAVLLVVVGYQNLVTYPRLNQKLNSPRVLPFAVVTPATWGSSAPVIPIRAGQGFLLFVRVPPDGYAQYTADLYNPVGKREWSLSFPASSVQDQWPLQVPGRNREAGTYTLKVRGVTSAGESKEIGSTSFELQIEN